MVLNWLMVFGLASPVGPYSPAAAHCFELVMRFDPAKFPAKIGERDRIENALIDQPEAVWAVLLGSQNRNADVAARCSWILHVWKTRREESRYREIVQRANGDFDRFLNSMLISANPDLQRFEAASDVARVFDRYYVKKLFPSLTLGKGSPTPFHDLSDYLQLTKPTVVNGFLQTSRQSPSIYLARCEGVNADELLLSMVLSDGNVNVDRSFRCLIISGGDIKLSTGGSAMVFAAGDVTVETLGHALVFAGGKVTLGARATSALIATPEKIESTNRTRFSQPVLILDGKAMPAADLFVFRNLWEDYGLQTDLTEGRLKITKIKTESIFIDQFKEGDSIVSHTKRKIDATGQFRRLLSHSLDTGVFDFDIERAGKKMTIRADLKKK